MPSPEILPASRLGLPALRELFNAGYSDYLRPLQLDVAAFSDHVRSTGVDLECSRVVALGEPASLALIAPRGTAAWVAGVATVPAARRQGLAELALASASEAARERGCREVWLEVIDANLTARSLYERLGFEVARDVIVWILPPSAVSPEATPASLVPGAQARDWIAAHRPSREPWQRSDATVAAVAGNHPPLIGLTVKREGTVAGAALFRCEAEVTRLFQIAACDDVAARELILAAAAHGQGRALRLSNAPVDEPPSRAFEQLGADVLVRQHEMRLAL